MLKSQNGGAKMPGGAPENHRYRSLDALRGIAALAVAQRHTYVYFNWLLPQSYLAVDLFFVLSGFVIAHTYEAKLRDGLSVASFMKSRLARLYPLYAFAMLFGLAIVIVDNRFLHLGIAPMRLLVAFALTMVFLPTPFLLHPLYPVTYPFSHSCWSLFFELIANLLHGIFACFLTTPRLIIFMLINGLWLAYAAIVHGAGHGIEYLGISMATLLYGIPRVLFPYCAGVLLHRLHKRLPWRPCIPAVIPIAAIIALLWLSLPVSAPFFDLLAVGMVIPAIVFAAAYGTEGRLVKYLFLPLGAWSYALYVIHPPLAVFFAHVFKLATHARLQTVAPLGGVGFLIILVLASWALTAGFNLVRCWRFFGHQRVSFSEADVAVGGLASPS